MHVMVSTLYRALRIASLCWRTLSLHGSILGELTMMSEEYALKYDQSSDRKLIGHRILLETGGPETR